VLSSCTGTVRAADEPSTGTTSAARGQDSPAEVRLHLLRHGEAVFNAKGVVAGWADSPLTPTGAEEAAQAGRALSDVPFVAAWTSDMVRTRDTAASVLAAHPAPPTLKGDATLREWHFGGLEGERNEGLAAVLGYGALEAAPAAIGEYADLFAAADPWGLADDRVTVEQRAAAALDMLLADALALGGGDVLVVTHGMAILTMLSVIDPEVATTSVPGNVAASRVVWRDQGWTIEAQNDASYLAKADAVP
jgi:probable phosphoglycerate mutase